MQLFKQNHFFLLCPPGSYQVGGQGGVLRVKAWDKVRNNMGMAFSRSACVTIRSVGFNSLYFCVSFSFPFCRLPSLSSLHLLVKFFVFLGTKCFSKEK